MFGFANFAQRFPTIWFFSHVRVPSCNQCQLHRYHRTTAPNVQLNMRARAHPWSFSCVANERTSLCACSQINSRKCALHIVPVPRERGRKAEKIQHSLHYSPIKWKLMQFILINYIQTQNALALANHHWPTDLVHPLVLLTTTHTHTFHFFSMASN